MENKEKDEYQIRQEKFEAAFRAAFAVKANSVKDFFGQSETEIGKLENCLISDSDRLAYFFRGCFRTSYTENWVKCISLTFNRDLFFTRNEAFFIEKMIRFMEYGIEWGDNTGLSFQIPLEVNLVEIFSNAERTLVARNITIEYELPRKSNGYKIIVTSVVRRLI